MIRLVDMYEPRKVNYINVGTPNGEVILRIDAVVPKNHSLRLIAVRNKKKKK